MATKFNGMEKQIAEAAQRIIGLMPNDIDAAPRHIMILVNVAGRAEELRIKGNAVEGIPKSAAEYGARVAFDAQNDRYFYLRQKAADTARLFINNKQLALDACEAFIQIRIEHRKLRGLGDEKNVGDDYRNAMQAIINAIELSEVADAATETQENGQNDTGVSDIDAAYFYDFLRDREDSQGASEQQSTDARFDAIEKRLDKLEGAVKGLRSEQFAIKGAQKGLKNELEEQDMLNRPYGPDPQDEMKKELIKLKKVLHPSDLTVH
jgi:hypothetical protein